MSDVTPLRAGGNCAERNRNKIFDEFGSILEESVIILIIQDYDIVKNYQEIRNVLKQLAEDASAEAATGFDPSGLGSSLSELENLRLDDTTTTSGDRNTSGYGSSEGRYTDYGSTTPSSDISAEHHESHNLTSLTDLSDDDKVRQLQGIFIDRFKEHTIKHYLKQNNGDLDRTFDDLLSRQFLDDSGQNAKGIDAFFMPDESFQRPRKGKKNKNGNSKPKPIKVDINYKTKPLADGGELQGAKDFIQPSGSRTPIISKRILPPNLPSLGISPAYSAPTSTVTSPTGPLDYGAAHLRSASALSRKGPLGRQAAVVYTERAREANRTAMTQSSVIADDHVRKQSTDKMVDLHGVYVLDGVRIARQHVWAWWNSLESENRASRAKREGFTVVTGIGKHSVGGVSRLRQAVAAMLKNDGWKVETLTGSFLVLGRV